jgi:hypothetical protein
MMDCRTCEPTLIDLVHSELATDAAREAHAHLATCATCRTSFETLVAATRLAAQLPVVEPPPHVAARVMELAEAHARDVAARQRVAAPQPTPWQALLDFVGRLATRPQVAMATIMVLIVAVGFWSLPRLRHQASPPVAGVVVNPEPEGEAAPGTGVAPADRLDLKVDVRAGRIRSKDGMPVPAAAPTAVAAVPAPTSVADQALAERHKDADDPLATLDDLDLGEAANKQDTAGSMPAKHARAETASVAKPAAGGREFAQGPPAAAAASAAAPKEEAAKVGKGAASDSSATERVASGDQQAQLRARRNEGAALGEAAEPEPQLERNAAAKPKAAYPPAQTGAGQGFAQAAPMPAQQPAAQSPADLLTVARAHAKRGGCLAAMPDYQRLVLQDPTSAEAGSALIELAQCRRNAGDIDVARALLRRAAAIPEVAARARALLATLSGAAK